MELEHSGQLFAAVEAGGTKFNCALVTAEGSLLAETRIPTTSPHETLAQVIHFFRQQKEFHRALALGIASFGPLDLNPASPAYGSITSTPKPGWQNSPILSVLQNELGLPTAIETDVNAAALGELTWNPRNRGLDPFLYMTVGTGIGVGPILQGKPVHGLQHPEAGHMFVPHDLQLDPFPGACPFHQDCLEGLATGGAMHKRWGIPAYELPAGHPGWDLEAHYLALACCNLILSFSPQKIVIGGGVAQNDWLIPAIQRKTVQLLNGYVHHPQVLQNIESLITPASLGTHSGILGAAVIAMQVVKSAQ